MKNRALLIVLITILLSCGKQSNSENCSKMYYYDKNMGDMYQEKYNLPDKTIIIKYKPNGNIYSVEHFKNGNINIQHGSSIYFYENGNIQSLKNYINGKQNGENIYFYDNQILDEWFRLKIVGRNLSNVNEFIRTNDTNGNIDNQISEYFTVKTSYDTIPLGKTYNYEIASITSESTEEIYLVVGNFDDKFNIGATEKLDTIWFEKNCFTPYAYQEVKTTKKGPHIIRGIVNNIKRGQSLKNTQYTFQLNYFVK